MTKKLKIQLSLFVVAILFNIWGILSILQVGIGINVGLTYLDKIKDFHIILCYVIIVITMAIGIMGASINAGQLYNIIVLKGLTIGITTYRTVLTIPLLLAFVCFVVYPTNVDLAVYGSGLGEFIDGMFGTIAKDLGTIFGPKEWGGFGSKGLLITVYVLGIIMSIAFLAVPIISAVQAIKNANKKELNKSIEE